LFLKICFVSLCLAFSLSITAQQKFSFTESKMGSPFTVMFYSTDSLRAASLAKQCFKLVDSFNLIFSDYTDTSELGKLNASAGMRTEPTEVSPALYEVLMLSKQAFEKSYGSFDITMGAVVQLWRNVRKTKQFPEKETVQSVLKLTGFQKLIIDTVHHKLLLPVKGMQLDAGGIAKGWIAQQIIDFLKTEQVDHALVDAGGDIVMSNAPSGSNGWAIGVNVPETGDELLPGTLQLQNKAVATSGDVYRYIEKDGKKYSHITDPRTGYGVTSQRNVTVIAGDGATADWLATACSILSIKKAKSLAVRNGADVLIGVLKKDKLVFYSTKGFKRYRKQQD